MSIAGVLELLLLSVLMGYWLLSWKRLVDRLPTLDASQGDAAIHRWSRSFGWGLAGLVALTLLAIILDDVLHTGWTDEMVLPVVSVILIALAGGAWTSSWTDHQMRMFLGRE